MKIKIIYPCLVSREHCEPGTILTIGEQVSDADAGRLIRMGRAEKVETYSNKPAKRKENA